MSKDEVRLSIEEEQQQEEEMEIPTSDEDTSPHKDHVFYNSDGDLLRDLKKQEAKTTSGDHQAGQNGRRKVLTKIQKVPKIVKLQDQSLIKQYFTPSEISIGPVHAKNNQLINSDLKLRLAARFVAESKQTDETLLGKVKDDIAELKECYDKDVVEPFDDDCLARILFLDGCSVLQFVHGFVRNNLNELKISTGQSGSIQNELFLLENQVPFRLLKLLIILSVEKFELVKSVYEFLAANIMSPPDYYGQRHFDNLVSLESRKENDREPILFDKDKEPVHLLDLLRSELLFGSSVKNDHETIDCHDLQIFYKRSFRNVQDLKATGIKFKPSKSSSFRAVSFSTRLLITGRLSLPPMIVDNSTASKLWNLAAYEMCPDNYACDFGVSSYMRLLDMLVDNEQDVRDLRAEHVLRNRLSSDEEVARLFNTIGSNLVSKDAYLGVKIKIQQHYERKCAVWVAQVYHDHFSSPWTVLALIAAVVALVLTGFSTWYTVYPKKL